MRFEKITAFADSDIALPQRKTTDSAGYDFVVAEDTLIPSYSDLMYRLTNYEFFEIQGRADLDEVEKAKAIGQLAAVHDEGMTLEDMAALTKKAKAKPTLVPTGMKCYLDKGTYLELSVRSSCPLKHWLILANGVGVIDADYVNNPDNEGHIYFQMINLSPFSIILKKGDIIGQGIIKPYLITDNDIATGKRLGGFGSTSNEIGI